MQCTTLYGRIVRESGYTPTVFSRMIEQHGGLDAAHRLLKPEADFFSYGFEHLCQMRVTFNIIWHRVVNFIWHTLWPSWSVAA